MQNNLIDTALDGFAGRQDEIFLTLRDNSTLRGKVDRFDGYVVLLSGEPPQIVYRHSILKVSSSPPEPARETVREVKESRPPRAVQRPPREAAPRRKPSRPRPERPAPANKEQETGGFSQMGEEMMKWLKSQKGK